MSSNVNRLSTYSSNSGTSQHWFSDDVPDDSDDPDESLENSLNCLGVVNAPNSEKFLSDLCGSQISCCSFSTYFDMYQHKAQMHVSGCN